MTIKKLLGLAALAASVAAPTAAVAQPGWWGPGWNQWREHRYYGPGGPRYWDQPGRYYGWYNYRGRYYRNCGYRIGPRGARIWRCY